MSFFGLKERLCNHLYHLEELVHNYAKVDGIEIVRQTNQFVLSCKKGCGLQEIVSIGYNGLYSGLLD